MSVFSGELGRLCAQNGFDVSEHAMRSMEVYYNCLVETNKKHNLTAIVEAKDAALKHFLIALSPMPCCLKTEGLRMWAAAQASLLFH